MYTQTLKHRHNHTGERDVHTKCQVTCAQTWRIYRGVTYVSCTGVIILVRVARECNVSAAATASARYNCGSYLLRSRFVIA